MATGSRPPNGGAREATDGGSRDGGSTGRGADGSGRNGGAARGDALANALGWFSIGLGVAQLAAPRRMARLVGASGDETSQATMRTVGAREVAAGVGLLSQPRPAWAWGRVAGDVMDLALLGRTMSTPGGDRDRAVGAAAAVVGVMALDVVCAQRLASGGHAGVGADHGIAVQQRVTVNRPPEEVYAFWRNFENLPRFMHHLEEVRVLDGRRSHWTARAPAGTSVAWDAETTDDRPNELIAWRSVEGADVPNEGEVRFVRAAGGRGTEVHVRLRYEPPAGKLGALVAKLFGEEPNQQVAGDLRRFKQVLETGEVVYSDATVTRGMHPARPSAERRLPREDYDMRLVDARAGDAASASSNRDRASSTPTGGDRPVIRA